MASKKACAWSSVIRNDENVRSRLSVVNSSCPFTSVRLRSTNIAAQSSEKPPAIARARITLCLLDGCLPVLAAPAKRLSIDSRNCVGLLSLSLVNGPKDSIVIYLLTFSGKQLVYIEPIMPPIECPSKMKSLQPWDSTTSCTS